MKILFILCCTLIINVGFSQTTTIVNQKTYGGDMTDVFFDITLLNNGTYVICGGSESGATGNKTTTNYGTNDGWVLNINQDLTINWQLNLGGTGYDVIVNSIATNDGGFILIGTSDSPISGNKTAPNKGGSDVWIIKISNSGVIEWQKTYGGSGNDQSYTINEFNDGNYLISCASDSPISGDKSEASRGGKDYWLLKITSTGNIIWDKTIGGDADDITKNSFIDNNQNVFISGESKSSLSSDKTENNYGPQDIWIIKLDSSGSIIWDKTIGGNSFEQTPNVQLISNKLFVSCTSDSPVSGNKTATNNGLTDYWLISLDTNGNVLWDKTYGGSSSQTFHKSFVFSNDKFVLIGNSNSGISGTKTEPNIGNQDMWLVMIDTVGSEIWQKTIGGSLYDALDDVYRVGNNHYIFAGNSWSNADGDKTENAYGFSDYWLLELTTNLGINEISKTLNYTVYPNPTSGQFTVNGLQTNSTISVYNLQGKLIKQIKTAQQTNININLSNLQTGVYLINIQNKVSNKTIKLVVE